MAREGMEMRRNQIRDQAPQAGGSAEGQVPGFPGMGMDPSLLQMQERSAAGFGQTTPLERQAPEFAPGITLGPGRAGRMPDQGSPEYEQLVARVRALRGRGNR
jgi:hypothetical protein